MVHAPVAQLAREVSEALAEDTNKTKKTSALADAMSKITRP